MYQYLTGKLVEKSPTVIALDVGGVGYQIAIPLSTYSALPTLDQTVRVLTHFVVREDAHALYGFLTEEERQMFRLLLSISGIGPKMAITILSGTPLRELKQAIIDGALATLTAISGIGRKTAERIIVELREKIVLEERRAPSMVTKPGIPEAMIEDSIQALIELGYRKQNAKEALQKALKVPEAAKFTVSDLIRASLKYI